MLAHRQWRRMPIRSSWIVGTMRTDQTVLVRMESIE